MAEAENERENHFLWDVTVVKVKCTNLYSGYIERQLGKAFQNSAIHFL